MKKKAVSKILAGILAAAMALSMAACGDDAGEGSSTGSSTPESQKTTAALVKSPRQTVKAAKKVRGGRKAIAEALL